MKKILSHRLPRQRASTAAVWRERAGVITGPFCGAVGGRYMFFCLVIFFPRGTSIHKRNGTESSAAHLFGCTPLRGHSRGFCRLDAPKALATPPLSRRYGSLAVGSMPIEPTADDRAGRRQSEPEAPFWVRGCPDDPPLCVPTLVCPPRVMLCPSSAMRHAMAPLRPAQAPSSR